MCVGRGEVDKRKELHAKGECRRERGEPDFCGEKGGGGGR